MEVSLSYGELKQQIKRLEQSEHRAKDKLARFQKFLDDFPFGIYIVNKFYQIQYTNSLLRKQFGDPNDLKCHQYFHNLETPCTWCKNDKVLNGETVVWYWHSEKADRDYELFDLPLKNEDGSISKIEIFHDITELKQKEKELIKSDALLKETQAMAKIGGWELDLETGQVSWTDEVFRIYGVAPGSYDPTDIGKDMSFYAPQSRPVLKKAFQNALENGEPYDLELEFVRAGKEQIWVRTMGRPEKKDGKVVRIKGNFIDITDFKHLSQKQERSLALLEKVYESLDEAVFVVEPQNRKILSCNAASERIFGYSKKEMIGKNTEFLHVNKKAYKEYGKKFARALASGTEFHIEYSLKNKDGKVFPTEQIVKAVQDESGLPPIHVMVVKDMTFRKLAEKQLQYQQEELKNRAQRLEELNAALKVLLDQREREKRDLETQLSERVNGLIIPTLNKMRDKNFAEYPENLIDILEANINEITKPVHQNISTEMMSLSPTETTIADLVKIGYQTKEIASKMSISARTVEFHRDNIRKKLNIKGRKVNLKTYLARLS